MYETEENEVITYNDFIEENCSINAQGKGKHFLAITKLDDNVIRADGVEADYELLYRELSRECKHERDQSYVCVQYSELTYYTESEMKEINTDNLFQAFNLF